MGALFAKHSGMNNHKYITINKAIKNAAKALIVFCLAMPSGHSTAIQDSGNQQIDRTARRNHARELIGSRINVSALNKTSTKNELKTFILKEIQASLPEKWKKNANRISQTIIEESLTRGWDPIFLMAVIKTESSFNPDARGSLGEIGLMQIRPSTAVWISNQLGVPKTITKNIQDPVMNIKTGAAYFAFLRQRFIVKNHLNNRSINKANSKLYIAAYNMGLQNVRRAITRNVTSFIYPKRVLKHYEGIYSRIAKNLIVQNIVATVE